MAVQQNKKSPSKRGMHRSHNALTVPQSAEKQIRSLIEPGAQRPAAFPCLGLLLFKDPA